MKKVGPILQELLFDVAPVEEQKPDKTAKTKLSQRGLKKADIAATARQARDEAKQDLGFNARPFTVTNLPVRPKQGLQVWERKNGNHQLRIEAATGQMLPYGQDRLVLLLLATYALKQKSRVVNLGSAIDILRLFGKSDGGKNYEMLAQSFHRIMAASITWSSDGMWQGARLIEASRMLLLEDFRLWAGNSGKLPTDQPGDQRQGVSNIVTLSQKFYDELVAHPIPIDMHVVRGLLDSPGALDFYIWVAYRAYRIPSGQEIAVPLFGNNGLQSQLGSECRIDYKFRQQIRRWIEQAKTYWPECPVRLSEDGEDLLMVRGLAIRPSIAARL